MCVYIWRPEANLSFGAQMLVHLVFLRQSVSQAQDLTSRLGRLAG